MSASAATLTRTLTVGRYVATLTAGPGEGGVFTTLCEWEPHQPNTLTETEKESYRRGLAAFAIELGQLARNTQPK